ncbi:uncharacterized protein PHALS_09839 [Plasmopara halstedii]|uniref:Uncharacterized protein n=1 Tax=Plasmopara halstedii TaxID=4781 RepID=A0A0P1AEV1_PLAHL|nr:uncharacterized protein PHALS_09839 [Plasmopara halstedii]CEG39601.1 hypothetical protein PHALS_09839 [Plasmopara halstedii]|eukprot:XP_024575970.1 hypothetical protein PHALS_09839 [Plasmopara halstedii]
MTLNSKNVVERLKIAPEILKIVCLRQIILCELQLTENCSGSLAARSLMAPITPQMNRVDVRGHFEFVPCVSAYCNADFAGISVDKAREAAWQLETSMMMEGTNAVETMDNKKQKCSLIHQLFVKESSDWVRNVIEDCQAK